MAEPRQLKRLLLNLAIRNPNSITSTLILKGLWWGRGWDLFLHPPVWGLLTTEGLRLGAEGIGDRAGLVGERLLGRGSRVAGPSFLPGPGPSGEARPPEACCSLYLSLMWPV